MYYNPTQQRIDNIDSQIQMLQQQKIALQNYQPPIQQTFIQQSPTNNAYDFNGIWVNGYDEAKKIANDTKPILIFDKDEDRFYIKEINGDIKAYEFKEVAIIEEKNDDVSSLKSVIEDLKRQVEELKRGTKNEPIIQTNEQSYEHCDDYAKKPES